MNKYPKREGVKGLALLTVLLLGACSSASATELEGASPQQRYEYDYTGGTLGSSSVRPEQNGGHCLDNTSYDTTGSAPLASLTTDENGIIIVTPSGAQASNPDDPNVLRLVNQGNDKPLQPANDISRLILESKHCKIDAY